MRLERCIQRNKNIFKTLYFCEFLFLYSLHFHLLEIQGLEPEHPSGTALGYELDGRGFECRQRLGVFVFITVSSQ
jgi:hypothetical protein